jgi:hypothetical protein
MISKKYLKKAKLIISLTNIRKPSIKINSTFTYTLEGMSCYYGFFTVTGERRNWQGTARNTEVAQRPNRADDL